MFTKEDLSKLSFIPVSENSKTLKASLDFPNKYGVNIYKYSSNTNRECPYEFELTKNHIKTSNQNISDDNVGYCSEDEIVELIHLAQRLRS